jgi:hypothetical protein
MAAQHITTLTALRALYGPARERALKKEIPSLDAHAGQFILFPAVKVSQRGCKLG